jgi:iron complex transport system substrate-binding protein
MGEIAEATPWRLTTHDSRLTTKDIMRIISLLPSTTEIVCALGLADDLVAVTHECDYPPVARTKPAVTASALDAASNSATIDRLVAGSIHDHRAIYSLDEDLLRELRPDLILTQELCDVCAVSYSDVQKAARILPDGDTTIVSLEPLTLDDILATISLVGRLTTREEQAGALVAGLRARIARVAEVAATATTRPRVYCMEWIDPPFRAGHWIPELARLAGGEELLGHEGVPSTRTTWEEIAAAAPDVVVAMPCGFDADRAKRELCLVAGRLEWQGLPAVARGDVWVTDGSAYFARPGPRMVDALEILAHALHPTLFPAPPPHDLRRFV